MHVISLET